MWSTPSKVKPKRRSGSPAGVGVAVGGGAAAAAAGWGNRAAGLRPRAPRRTAGHGGAAQPNRKTEDFSYDATFADACHHMTDLKCCSQR